PFTVLFDGAPDFVNPYAQQASLSVERQIAPDLSVSVGYTFVRTLKISRQHDVNVLPAPVEPRLGIPAWTNQFVNPLVAEVNRVESNANAVYSGMTVEVKKRFSRSFTLNGNYTFSKATDDVVDFNLDYQPADQTCLRCEHALSSFDQRHKVVAYGLWNTPGGF